MLEDAQTRELLGFLTLVTRLDVKSQATEYVLGLTGSADGRSFLARNADFLQALLTLTRDPSRAVVKDCYCALVNLSADESAHRPLVSQADLLPSLLKNLCDPEYDFSDQVCSILSNLSRRTDTCREVFRAIQSEGVGLAKIVEVFCTDGYNKKGALHYLGPLLSNLTQLPEARQFILDKDRCVVQRLLPYTQYEGSGVRRGGVVGTLRNCCFDYAYHEWLLGSEVDILPFLLLPLAGPEELSEDEMEGLPVDLQYLPEDKQREEDPDIRRMLLEAINLLMATKGGRKAVRDRNAYVILRELHKWEPEPDVAAACEKLIEVLISDEPEAGMENLLEVEIPEDVERKLTQQDEEERRRLEEQLLKSRGGGQRAQGESPEGRES
ncbi:protein HGH1 homolog [Pristis pectinata]|uniref:protein HGH1 homolog n=1 Tax=Pristis pectinata TaxID=685728 RepID=UPI00223DFBA2|nr:protein HGH1 homolog [Pristis pectinata]XP_051871941.1 protein HGH1 homolog [Pristis pectinata]